MREAALRESEERYRRLFEFAPIGIIMTEAKSARYKHVNPAFCRMMGYRAEELVGMTFLQLTHPEDLEQTLIRHRDMRANLEVSYPVEKRFVKKNGEVLWSNLTVTRVFDPAGQPMYYLAMIEDISERKQALQLQLLQAAAQRYSLVREVHHRIKNNLQSVAGLLGRELGGHAELHPRLAVAISQVNAIATVHGLKSAGSSETILLGETLEQICKSVGEQTRRAIDWRIEDESADFRPVQIAEIESVPIALVLNELVFNAVKHTPPEGPSPRVSLASDGVSCRVRIVNAARAGKHFDWASKVGINTGLRLLHSLMPLQGAALSYEGSGSDRVVSELLLSKPVVMPALEGCLP